MIHSVRTFTPLALALLVSMAGMVSAGDNEGATFSITSATTISDVGANAMIEISVTGDNWVNVKQVDAVIDVSAGADFPILAVLLGPEMPTSAAFPPGDWVVPAGGQLDGDQYRVGWALLQEGLDGALTGSATFTLRLLTSPTFTNETEATIMLSSVSLGPSSDDRDVVTVGATVTINPGVPPVIEPTLAAVGATDVSLDYGNEATFTVAFTDNTGAAAAGQEITWTVTNNGAESVFLGSTEIAASSTETVTGTTNADG